MLAWRHSGFSVHNQVRVAAGDAAGRKSLAGYMLRAPFSLEKTTYDAASGTLVDSNGKTRSTTGRFRSSALDGLSSVALWEIDRARRRKSLPDLLGQRIGQHFVSARLKPARAR